MSNEIARASTRREAGPRLAIRVRATSPAAIPHEQKPTVLSSANLVRSAESGHDRDAPTLQSRLTRTGISSGRRSARSGDIRRDIAHELFMRAS
jgi:hypothetical protein